MARTVYDLAKEHRKRIIDRESEAVQDLIQAYGESYKTLTEEAGRFHSMIDARAAELGVSVADVAQTDPSWPFRADNLSRQRDVIAKELAGLVAETGTKVEQLQGWGVRAALDDAAELSGQAAIDRLKRSGNVDLEAAKTAVIGSWNRPNLEGLRAIVGTTADGTPLGTLLANRAVGTAEELRTTFVQAFTLGQNPRAMAPILKKHLGSSLSDAMRLARTEVIRAYRIGTQASFDENPDIVTGWVWHCALDGRSCLACVLKHGEIHRVSEILSDHPQGRCAMVPRTPSWEKLGEKFGLGGTRTEAFGMRHVPTEGRPFAIASSEGRIVAYPRTIEMARERLAGNIARHRKFGSEPPEYVILGEKIDVGLGALDEAVPAIPSGVEWLNSQALAVQVNIMGPTRTALWRSGKFKPAQFVTEVQDAVWGKSYRPTPLKTLVPDPAELRRWEDEGRALLGKEPRKRAIRPTPVPTGDPMEALLTRAATYEGARPERLARLEADGWPQLEKEGKAPWQRPQEDFVADQVPGFRYTPGKSYVANANDPLTIAVSEQFFDLGGPAFRKLTIHHEIAHDLADSLTADGLGFDLAEAGAMGTLDPKTGRLVGALNGGQNFEEIFADAYAQMFDGGEPFFVKDRWPDLYDAVYYRAKAMGLPVPETAIPARSIGPSLDVVEEITEVLEDRSHYVIQTTADSPEWVHALANEVGEGVTDHEHAIRAGSILRRELDNRLEVALSKTEVRLTTPAIDDLQGEIVFRQTTLNQKGLSPSLRANIEAAIKASEERLEALEAAQRPRPLGPALRELEETVVRLKDRVEDATLTNDELREASRQHRDAMVTLRGLRKARDDIAVQVTRETLAEIRQTDDILQNWTKGGDRAIQKAIDGDEVGALYPKTWLQKSADAGPIKTSKTTQKSDYLEAGPWGRGGAHQDAKMRISGSPSTARRSKEWESTVVHEMGHRFEDVLKAQTTPTQVKVAGRKVTDDPALAREILDRKKAIQTGNPALQRDEWEAYVAELKARGAVDEDAVDSMLTYGGMDATRASQVEVVVQGLGNLEAEYLSAVTNGYTTPKIKVYGGYARERADGKPWATNYSGKVYDGTYHELFTTGMEAVRRGGIYVNGSKRADLKAMNPDLYDFVLGVWAGLP